MKNLCELPPSIEQQAPFALRKAYALGSQLDELMKDHRDAMACRECESFLLSGIDFFRWIREAEKQVTLYLRQPEIELSSQQVDLLLDSVKSLYQIWIRPCKKADDWLAKMKQSGFEVEYEAEYLTCKAEGVARVEQFEMDDAHFADISPMEAEEIKSILKR